MNKILISIDKNCLNFSKYNREISPENLNNTNVINVKNLKFTEDYINENMELMSTFLSLIVLKFKINRAVIKSLEISETVLALINTLDSIEHINFSEDKELTYTACSLLLENKNLNKIECYSLPIIMFYRFDKDLIQTRCEILSKSDFVKINNINTFSDVFNKDRIIINEQLTKQDVNDLICFINSNKNLKKIEFKKYDRKNLEATLSLLKENNLKKIKIIINEQSETTTKILNDIKLFDKLNKKYDVNIKINYSKEYKEKNRIKELNITILKYILLACICIGIIFFISYKLLEKKNTKTIEENIDKITEKVEGITNNIESNSNSEAETKDEQYISSYYKNYSKVYEELLRINSDTIGWLTVNNTKINYPVVQAKDNDYYLNHAYDKTKNNIGWIFADYRNDMDNISQNTIIYGHSMVKSGLMFSTLEKTLDSKWYNNTKNLEISFNIKGKDIKWQIFSIYTVEKTSDYITIDFINEEAFINFISTLKNRSVKKFNVDVKSSDKILTLSTCYKDDNHRIVVHAKML